MNVDVLLTIMPPVLGATIGYVTNAVAIKMLFRPYREWRIFGLRVPFTPGIIPRRRGNFADSIGGMVTDELLTEDTVVKQTSSSSFVEGLKTSVAELTSRGLDLRVSTILGTTGFGRDRDLSGVGNPHLLSELIIHSIQNDRFKLLLRNLVERGFADLGDKQISSLSLSDGRSAVSFISDMLIRFVTADEQRMQFKSAIISWYRLQRDEKTLAGIFSPKSPKLIAMVVGMIYEPVAALLLQWLRSDDVKAILQQKGKVLLRDIFRRFTTLQKLFIAAAQYDRQLESNMAQIVEDALQAAESVLDEPKTKNQLIELVNERVSSLRAIPISELGRVAGLEPDDVELLLDDLVDSLGSLDGVKPIIESLLGPFGERTIGELLRDATDSDGLPAHVAEVIRERLIAMIRGESKFPPGESFESAGIEKVSDLINLRQEHKESIDSWIANRAVALVNAKVPKILESLDVRKLVVDKINGLEVEQVEVLLLRVIHRHLKWINVFGAILGFLIGMIQLVTRLFQ